MPSSSSRSARIFLSSTFRDFGEERDLLVRRVFPALRARLKDRFVDLVDVDLRWGITAEQAERGEVLPICLAEIDRARPYFVGMLGERYGWIPPEDGYALDLLERHEWLHDHRGGKSVTELEILHGVLNDPEMAGRAFFYFRSADYAAAKGGDYVPTLEDDRLRQKDLKDRIRKSGFPVVEDYSTPEAFAAKLEKDLWTILDEAYPADQVPDAFERESRRHEAYAIPRRRLYLGGEAYGQALTHSLEGGQQRILIEGQSGGGKSALIANWLQAYADSHPDVVVFEHYTAASADAADSVSLVRRLIEHIKRVTGSSDELPTDPEKLLESLPLWFANASAWGSKEGRRWVFTIDALNGLSNRRDLRWFPEFLPERVHLVISSLSSGVMDALLTKGDWQRLLVNPLTEDECKHLLTSYLARYNKTLTDDLARKALSHPLSTNPLFLRTLAEELRVFGLHEQIKVRLDYYLESQTVDDLFERVLERVEGDCGQAAVQASMEAIWASRAGLAEQEILKLCNLAPLEWATIRAALDDVLIDSAGRITFAHDYLRIAISDRYLKGNNALDDETQSDEAKYLRRSLHTRIANWFEEEFLSGIAATKTSEQEASGSDSEPAEEKPQSTETVSAVRAAEEIPYQWQEAQNWERLKVALTNKDIFEAVYDNRSNQELLSYWLQLEQDANADVERDYEEAWNKWAFEETTEATGDIASNLGSFLRDAGRYKEFTERLTRLACEIVEKAQGPEHPDTGASLNNLALLLQDKADYDAAEPLYRRALAIAEKAQGPEHPDTGRSLSNLASLLMAKGDYDAAEPLYRRALAIAEKAQGPEHPETGTRLNNLAGLLYYKADYDAAEPLYRRALALAEKAQGPEHPDTGTCLNNLALLLQDKADYDAAEPLYRRALAIAEKAQGPEHPDTGTSLSNLASLLMAKGDYDAAEPLYRRALAIAEKAQGPEHPDTGLRLNNLALLLYYKADYDAAEPLYRRALAIAEKALGPEHPETGTYLLNLAILLKDKGDYDAAEPLFRRALAIAEKAQGPEHPDTGLCLNNLALLLQDKADYDAAEPLYRRALAIAEKAQGPEHPDTGTSLSNLASLLKYKADYDAAEPLYRRALAIAEKAQGEEHPQSTDLMYSLGKTLIKIRHIDEAVHWFRREIELIEARDGPLSKGLVQSLYNLGNVLADENRYDEAEQYLRREIEIIETNSETQRDSVAKSYHNLGVMLRNSNQFEKAEKELQKALSIFEKEFGAEAIETTATISALGQLYLLMERFDISETYLKKCLRIRERELDPEDEAIKTVRELLRELTIKSG
jgi:nephrocystin-3